MLGVCHECIKYSDLEGTFLGGDTTGKKFEEDSHFHDSYYNFIYESDDQD